MLKKGIVVSLTLILGLLLTLNSSAIAAPECTDITDSAGTVPNELLQLCANQSPLRQLNAVAPLGNTGNKATGWESASDIHVEFILDAPEVVNNIGGTGFGNFVGGCDYAGNDLSKIYCVDGGNNLFTSNSTTGATTLIGNFGALNASESPTSLDWDPVTNTMYMLSTSITSGSLYTLDLTAATATRMGATTGSNCPIAGGFDASGQLWSYDICDDNMYSINKSTGAASLIGPIGFDANFGQGMDFDPVTDTCYMFAFNGDTFQPELRTCDTTTGGSTLVGALGATTPGRLIQLGGAAVQPACDDLSDLTCIYQTVNPQPFCDSITESETTDGYSISTLFGIPYEISLDNDLIPLIERKCVMTHGGGG